MTTMKMERRKREKLGRNLNVVSLYKFIFFYILMSLKAKNVFNRLK